MAQIYITIPSDRTYAGAMVKGHSDFLKLYVYRTPYLSWERSLSGLWQIKIEDIQNHPERITSFIETLKKNKEQFLIFTRRKHGEEWVQA